MMQMFKYPPQGEGGRSGRIGCQPLPLTGPSYPLSTPYPFAKQSLSRGRWARKLLIARDGMGDGY